LAPLAIAPAFVLMGGGTGFLAMALLSPLMLLASWWEDRSHGGKDHRAAVAAYRQTIDSTAASVAESVRRSADDRWVNAPDPQQLSERATPTTALWERRPYDPDFLALRFGWGPAPTEVTYSVADGGDPALAAEVAAQLDPLLVAGSSPLVVDLREVGHVGVVGDPGDATSIQRWALFQVAVLNSPREVLLAAVVPDRTDMSWLTRLPHCAWRERGAVAAGTAEGRELLREISTLVEQRTEQNRSRMGGDARHGPLPAIVVLVDDAVELPRSLVTTLLEDGPEAGVHLLWFTDSRAGVPGHCGAVVAATGSLIDVTWTRTGHRITGASLDHVRIDTVERASWALTGLKDASTRDRAAELPNRVSLVDTLEMATPTPRQVRARWERAEGLGAPLGLGSEGPVTIDLREDGPHALLGGTTGAGKSELLQTLVGSLAATHPPDRLTFLLVDYKGGAAFKDCVDLPHTVGMVTDLDGHLVARVLVSLNAELSHREHVLASVGAKDLIDMQRKAPGSAPPSLLLVVDEFAALATELPEFVDGVVNLAQRGRSLGMHLLLATQRPAGAINDNIRANTNLRICLRMNDKADSEDVIGTPVAASLPRTLPGRAFVRTGSTELVEVQVAYSGGRSFGAGDQASRVSVAVPGRAPTVAVRSRDVEPEERTDLQELVTAIGEAFDGTGSRPPRIPWLPQLPDVITVDEVPAEAGTTIAIGLRDEPHRQAQVTHAIDLVSGGGLLVAGSSGSGKTTVLRTLAGRLAEQNSPDDVQMYAMDFGARGLSALRALPHVGDVVTAEEVDRVIRLLTILDRGIKARRALMAERGAASFGDLRSLQMSGHENPTPHLVVLLDGYASFAQAYERVDYGMWLDRLPTLIADGRSVGMHWVVTGERRLSIPSAVQAALPQRLVLRFHDPEEYDGFGLARAKVADAHLPAGRGFTDSSDEVQVAVYGNDGRVEDQTAALGTLAKALDERWAGSTLPPAVRLLPDRVDAADLPAGDMSAVPIGINDLVFETASLDLQHSSLLIAGARRSGKSTALATAARQLHRQGDATLVLLAPKSTPLSSLGLWSAVHEGSYPIADMVDEMLLDIDSRPNDAPWTVVVVDDAHELVDEMADTRLAELVARGADRRVRVLAAADKATSHRAFGGLLQRLRAERAGVVLQPDPDLDGDLFDAQVERRLRGGPPGRAVVVVDGRVELVQLATAEPPQ
jgi:S-DNA-T family DNA segregation ATPase FtsK/SpoIIIE